MSIGGFLEVWKSLRFNQGGKAFQNRRRRSARRDVGGQFPDRALHDQVDLGVTQTKTSRPQPCPVVITAVRDSKSTVGARRSDGSC